jgi:hypothetical protein
MGPAILPVNGRTVPEQAMFAPVRTTRVFERYAGCPFPPVEPKI